MIRMVWQRNYIQVCSDNLELRNVSKLSLKHIGKTFCFLFSELPETSFTRSISNPEAVMRRRRQQKLEKKLQQFRSKDGGPDTGKTQYNCTYEF